MVTTTITPDAAGLRRRAEKKLKIRKVGTAELAGMSLEKIEGLIHDLQVHQIELSIQNEELCRLREELEISRDRYSELFEQAPVGYFTLNQEGTIEAANLTLSAMLGVERRSLIGEPFTRFILDEDQDIYYHHRQHLAEAQRPQSCELRLVKKDGRTLHAGFECTTDSNRQGDAGLIRGAVIDITERQLALESKILLEDQLRQTQKMESVGTLAGGIAHEFNNILGIVLGNAELAINSVPEWNPARNHLEQICQASLRAKNIVQQLLSFSRKDASDPRPTNICPVVKEAMQLMRSSIPAQIDIQTDIPERCDNVLADATQIHQVVINLCANAADAMEESGGVLSVRMAHKQHPDPEAHMRWNLKSGLYVKLTIQDTGCGMPAQTLARIFDPYFTTKAMGKGTGIGLAVVHGIMSRLGGAVQAASTPGKGSTFTLMFPTTQQVGQAAAETAGGIITGTERILFVDDEPAMTKLGQQTLEHLGYTVEAVNEPLDALALFKSDPARFDLVITDMSMPEMTGDRLAHEILQVCAQTPIIICTGHGEKMAAEKALAAAVRFLLMKPYKLKDLALMVRKALDD